MKRLLNLLSFGLGAALIALAIDGGWEMAFVIVGICLVGIDFDYKPSVGEAAMRLLEQIYRKMYLLAFEIEREWRPMGGAESESKRLVLIAIRDQIPPRVQQLIEKESNK